MKIAYQGIKGSYSESCAQEMHPECETIACKTFDDVFNKANEDGEVRAIIPESNKTTGNIGVEYLIFKYRLNIYQEKFYPIHHHLFYFLKYILHYQLYLREHFLQNYFF